ncbi:hypothetical protein CYFUS_004708 [Cystobacter fuscus]|uniref:Uncharacterized protein n=1 Tax=Cystobacter fuscus TaxID=43 RepID=A0A250J5Q9_9BACT|nr:hypothetical protein CYFUS_004708 [Cystobacter fuscus]
MTTSSAPAAAATTIFIADDVNHNRQQYVGKKIVALGPR